MFHLLALLYRIGMTRIVCTFRDQVKYPRKKHFEKDFAKTKSCAIIQLRKLSAAEPGGVTGRYVECIMIKKLSIAEFAALLARPDWARSIEWDVTERMTREAYRDAGDTGDTGDNCLVSIPCFYGYAQAISTLDGVTIKYTESFSADEYDASSLTTSTDGQDIVWEFEGVEVIDEDGEAIKARDITDYFCSEFDRDSSFRVEKSDYGFLDKYFYAQEDIDMTTEHVDMTDAKEIVIERDNAPSIRFNGVIVAGASSSPDRSDSDYSGSVGRYTRLRLYKTVGGKYICQREGLTQHQGERDRNEAAICATLDEVKGFFGYGWLAQHLYSNAGIDYSEFVE